MRFWKFIKDNWQVQSKFENVEQQMEQDNAREDPEEDISLDQSRDNEEDLSSNNCSQDKSDSLTEQPEAQQMEQDNAREDPEEDISLDQSCDNERDLSSSQDESDSLTEQLEEQLIEQDNAREDSEEDRSFDQSQNVRHLVNESFSQEVISNQEAFGNKTDIKPIEESLVDQKKELIDKLKDILGKIKDSKLEMENTEKMDEEGQEGLSDQINNFFNQLDELPSFENREREKGYSIDLESYNEVPESIIRTLIMKFLNQRFCKRNIDLNVRANSLKKANGFYKWEIKDIIVHLQTHQVTKVLTDKYGYEYANGKNENVPLSFYFDLSGSMSSYTNMLSVIAIELLKKGVKVLVGFNEMVNVQIESIEKNITVSELAEILESAAYYDTWGNGRNKYKKDPRVKFKYVEETIDHYLIEKKAEKCVVFSDFDPLSEVINLSQFVDVYWFCFESRFNSDDLEDFNGFVYKVQNIMDLELGLLKINEKRFETLCYTDNPQNLQKKVRVKR